MSVNLPRQRRDYPRLALAVAASGLLASCSVLDGSPGLSPTGQVVGDEPKAVEVGATVLAHGGDAADAAAATYFALSVTYPVAAGIGGGGICIVYNSSQQKTEQFDFLSREASGGGPYAIPGNAAGFALLQSTYGRLPWQRVVSPAESYAAAGFSVSPALYARLATNQDTIRLDAELAREFLDEAGRLKPAGSVIDAPALAQTLSQLRVYGADALYKGAIADEIASYAHAQGGDIRSAELASYRPGRTAPLRIPINGETAFLPSDKVGAGRYARALFVRLADAQGQIIDADHTGAAVATATKATLDSFNIVSLPRDLGATGFAAVDPSGQAVSCAVSMGGPFGSGRTAGNSGVVLASAPTNGNAAFSPAFLAPAIATSGDAIAFAGAGAGGPNGTAMIALALLDLAKGNDLARPGVLHATGLEPFETANVIQCQSGTCAAVPDPKAFGLGAAGE
jgi:gamma-glutamyltranspeptidase/glutathione hydrolase